MLNFVHIVMIKGYLLMIGMVTDSSVTLVDFEGFKILNLVFRRYMYDEDFL